MAEVLLTLHNVPDDPDVRKELAAYLIDAELVEGADVGVCDIVQCFNNGAYRVPEPDPAGLYDEVLCITHIEAFGLFDAARAAVEITDWYGDQVFQSYDASRYVDQEIVGRMRNLGVSYEIVVRSDGDYRELFDPLLGAKSWENGEGGGDMVDVGVLSKVLEFNSVDEIHAYVRAELGTAWEEMFMAYAALRNDEGSSHGDSGRQPVR